MADMPKKDTIPLLTIDNIDKIYNLGKTKIKALSDVKLEVRSCEFVVIFGPSGAGKTTLLNCIAGLEKINSGNIYFNNENISNFNRKERAKLRRQKIGYIFQNINLIDSLTVEENIELPLKLSYISKEKRLKRTKECLNSLGLLDYSKRKVSELSGGERQRVAIARAIITDPDLILADEPTGNLDQSRGYAVIDLLSSLCHKQNRSVILVTHNPNYLSFADRVVYLEDGTVKKITVNGSSLCSNKTDISSYTLSKPKFSERLRLQLYFAWRFFKKSRKKSYLAVSFLSVGLAAILLSVIMAQNVFKLNKSDAVSTSNNFAKVTLRSGSIKSLDNTSVNDLRQLSAVSKVIPIQFSTGTLNLDSSKISVAIKCVDSGELKSAGVNLASGQPYQPRSGEALVTEDIISRLNTDAFSFLRKTFKLTDNQTGKIFTFSNVGTVTEDEIPTVYLPLGSLGRDYYDFIDVTVNQAFSRDQFNRQIESLDLSVGQPSTDQVNLANIFLIIEIIFIIISIMVTGLAIYSILSLLNLSLYENFHELGILKTLGINPPDLARIFVFQSLYIAILGGIGAQVVFTIINFVSSSLLRVILMVTGISSNQIFLVQPNSTLILTVFVVSFVMCLIATVLPIKKSATISAFEAMRINE